VRQHPRVEPGLTGGDVVRVDGQPLGQPEPVLGRPGGQGLDLRPRPLGVDVIRGERRDAAPVVDAGLNQKTELRSVMLAPQASLGDQVRGRLNPRAGPEDQPGDGDGRRKIAQFGVRHAGHRGVRLGPEVLDDHLLDAAVGPLDPADREQ
jgi:hypothetical protein